MGYYILQQDLRIVDQPFVMTVPEDLDPADWIDGRIMAPPRDPIRMSLSPRSGRYRGCIIGGIVTLFHQVFRDELTRLGIDNLQYFPVELENQEGKVEKKYSLVNVVGLLEAVDFQTSVIEARASGGRGRLRSFNIDPAATRGQKLFRIVENPTLIVIDESLRESLLKFNPPGVLMLPTERYEGYR